MSQTMSETCDCCDEPAKYLIVGKSLDDDEFRCEDHKLDADDPRAEYQTDSWR